MFEQIISEIKKYQRIIIHRHTNPDGDALGSQYGLKHLLRESFPEKEIYAVGDSSVRYGFIQDTPCDVIEDEKYKGALAIVLDTSSPALISDQRYTLAERTVRIDHHIFIDKICDEEVTDTSYESCAGMVADMALRAGFTISPMAARALYTGMVTDSGRFRYDSTSAKTHRIAGELMKREFKTEDIYANLYKDDFKMIRLRAQFVLKICFAEAGVAYIYTTREEAESLGVDTFTISRGMVNTMGDIRGVDVWVNFTETEAGVLCEIRSSKFNINPVATKYGGGGHAKASGATLKSRDEAMALLQDLTKIAKGESI